MGFLKRPEFPMATDYKADVAAVEKAKFNPNPPASELVYNIESGILKGNIGSKNICFTAGSGGRSGSKVPGAVNVLLANNSLATHIGGESSQGTHLYGPIPQGEYSLKMHETRENWIRLVPAADTETPGRNKYSFAIHGRGTIGSHGCIVPMKHDDLLLLCGLVKANAEAGNANVPLRVVAVGVDPGWQLRMA